MTAVTEARRHRAELLLDDRIDEQLALLFSAKTVGPEARFKLRNLLKFYAKKPKPFTACVRDNRKRFPAPGQVERICATVVDLIKGNTKWRNGGNHRGGVINASDLVYFDDSDAPPPIDDDVIAALDTLGPIEEDKLHTIYNELVEASE